MRNWKSFRPLQHGLLGLLAVTFVGARFVPGADRSGPVLTAATRVMAGDSQPTVSSVVLGTARQPKTADVVTTKTSLALNTLGALVEPLSHPKALETAFRSYFAFRSSHPNAVKKPYLYFVDYGQPSTQPRGYVFDMDAMKIVDGPFTVAHGRGSSTSQYGVPTRFSNRSGAATSSLGLYLTSDVYSFVGHTAGSIYHSIGLRLLGESGRFNNNALDRGVVAHGAPYVTPSKAGRSEGCPAMEQARAKRLLPKLANGAIVFLFAPDENWMQHDPWATANAG